MRCGDLIKHQWTGYHSIVMSFDHEGYVNVWTHAGRGKWRRGNCDVIQDLEDQCR